MLNDKEDDKMGRELVPVGGELVQISEDMTPTFFRDAGPKAAKRFIEFFVVNIRNPNTRAAYYRALRKFTDWTSGRIRLRSGGGLPRPLPLQNCT